MFAPLFDTAQVVLSLLPSFFEAVAEVRRASYGGHNDKIIGIPVNRLV